MAMDKKWQPLNILRKHLMSCFSQVKWMYLTSYSQLATWSLIYTVIINFGSVVQCLLTVTYIVLYLNAAMTRMTTEVTKPIVKVIITTESISVEIALESCFHEGQMGTQVLNISSRKKSSLHSKMLAVSVIRIIMHAYMNMRKICSYSHLHIIS